MFLSRFLILVFLIFQVTEECLERAIAVCNNGALFRKIGKRIRFKDYEQFFFLNLEMGIFLTRKKFNGCIE